ncbi:MAG: ABC transporter permease [Paracoccaceae bacterium]|nr:ABC transporter permease [Paracoccaceae bacterium]
MTNPPQNSNITITKDSAFSVKINRFLALLQRLLSNPTTVIGLIIIGLMLSMAIFAPWITTANIPDPYQMPRDWGAVRKPPGEMGYLLGTTNEGGDVFYGIVWGSRTSLQLSIYVVGSTMIIGTIIGSIAGLLGGWVDEVLMRIVDVFLSIPELIFALAIAAVLGPSFTNIIIALSLVIWVKYARIMRAQVLQIKQNDFVDAARIVGDSKFNIYIKDILPNAVTPVTVQATLDMGNVVLIGATLSFIGLSEAGIAEWGVLVSEGQAGIASGRWWASTFPGLMIFLWALAFNLLGDGLRDALDPRLEDR